MSRFQESKRNLAVSADLLRAFLGGGGDHTVDAEAGALVMADAIDCLRTVRTFLTKKRGGHG